MADQQQVSSGIIREVTDRMYADVATRVMTIFKSSRKYREWREASAQAAYAQLSMGDEIKQATKSAR